MKIFKDKNLTKELIEILDFGIVQAGETKQFKFWVLNDLLGILNELEFILEHKELKILKSPKELLPHAVGELIIEWSPSITLKAGLKTKLHIRGTELWG